MIKLKFVTDGRRTTHLNIDIFYLPFIVRLTGEATPRTVFFWGITGYFFYFFYTDLKKRYVVGEKMERIE